MGVGGTAAGRVDLHGESGVDSGMSKWTAVALVGLLTLVVLEQTPAESSLPWAGFAVKARAWAADVSRNTLLP